ncbi:MULTISPECIES: PQQ-dependent sugar dehydrogenase [Sphingomonas]|uniref:PQQ-dependent sugar dehydrogenase n=1 Tax=Sphingomonas TaxID=13687 RepID=UPI0006FE4C26|nr:MULTISPECIES: sorbosone dehydrogenase family protein [Sphingomonas]KQM91273.1 sorbosone dehydrogenase [Sphingomonas sp. Leaf226]MBD8701381.1 sorbosone dehydrogenase family protein [Sphingomonas sp. CFBP 13714]MDY0966248.1 sorbosone dehydrogenase family protein [Sphingomonas sp. CFBP9021]USQ99918.1 sorbosone dehydrogenase family protein [Sphingomonas aerolata]
MRKHILIVLGLIILVGIAGFTWLAWPDTARLDVNQVTGKRPDITAPRIQMLPTIGVAKAVGWPKGAMPTAAAGMKVQPFAAGLDHPRWLYRLPNGDVLVAETNSPPRKGPGVVTTVMNFLMGRAGAGVPSANRITLLRDADGDGVAETRSAFMTGLNSPFGMTLMDGQLYIGNTDALVRVPYTEGATRITAKPERVIPLNGGGNHWARNVIAAPDGKTLYVGVGSASNIAENGMDAEKYRANILQVWPKDKNWRIYAAGLRNPNGMAINPKSGQLWTVVNERDMLGSDLAPDYLTQVEFGDHFGWPWYYWGGYPDDRVEPKNPALQQYAKRPDYALGPHVAALGLTFASDAKLGDRFTNGVFVGEHGSWNRKPLSGYKVVYIPFGDTGFPAANAKPVDVLGGFLNKDGEAQGRPVGVITDKSGALLVADDVGNTIWRVSTK